MKLLFKLTENYFVGLRENILSKKEEVLFISLGNSTVYNTYNMVIEIDFPYQTILNMLDRNDIYNDSDIRDAMCNHLYLIKERDPCVYYYFVNELVQELRFDINNFTFYLVNYILKFIKNQIFI